jgi:hypothetical protein
MSMGGGRTKHYEEDNIQSFRKVFLRHITPLIQNKRIPKEKKLK